MAKSNVPSKKKLSIGRAKTPAPESRMTPLDALYAALVKEFDTVEVSPAVWVRLSDEWKNEAQRDLQIIFVPEAGSMAELAGFEIRHRKFVRVTLRWKDHTEFVAESVGIARGVVVPTQITANV
jgi:hypothetical protein